MSIRSFSFLFVIFFFAESVAQSNFFFRPDFGGVPHFLPRDHSIIPLCNNPLSLFCINQWSHQAQPLSLSQGSMGSRFQYFFPSFISERIIDDSPEEDDDWEYFTPSYSSSSSLAETRSFHNGGDFIPQKQLETTNNFSSQKDEAFSSVDSTTLKEKISTGVEKENAEELEENKDITKGEGEKESTAQTPLPLLDDGPVIEPSQQEVASETRTVRVKDITKREDENKSKRVEDRKDQDRVSILPKKVPLKNRANRSKKVFTLPSDPYKEVKPSSNKLKTHQAHPPQVNTEETQIVSRKFYLKTSEPHKVRVVETDRRGEKTVREGKIGLLPQEDIISTKFGEFQTKNKTISLPTTTTKKPMKKEKKADVSKGKEEERTGNELIKKEEKAEVSKGKEGKRTNCFVIDKLEETTTEATPCFVCDSQKEPVLSNFSEDLMNSIKEILETVTQKTKQKVSNKIPGGLKDITQKICSPKVSLTAIIDNFNRTCPDMIKETNENCLDVKVSSRLCPIHFNDFFKTIYCESCKKGIPPEVMVAMMSIESAGECSAVNSNKGETSSGLFQVDADNHSCRDLKGKVYKKDTSSNLKCLKNPINNLNKGIEILSLNYNRVNAQFLDESQCKSWVDMSSLERDTWRRGVAAYNGGAGWITRAIKSARNPETLRDTSYLINSHKKSRSQEYRKDPALWEKLRMYYFIEKLSPGNKPDSKGDKSGRDPEKSSSNLAHTEAVLGREAYGSVPGMVEFWTNYVRNNKPFSCSEKGQ